MGADRGLRARRWLDERRRSRSEVRKYILSLADEADRLASVYRSVPSPKLEAAREERQRLFLDATEKARSEAEKWRLLALALMQGDRVVNRELSNAELSSRQNRFADHRIVVEYDEVEMKTRLTFAAADDLKNPLGRKL
jgi:hypothetical protein